VEIFAGSDVPNNPVDALSSARRKNKAGGAGGAITTNPTRSETME
jgi:hypothetical protein